MSRNGVPRPDGRTHSQGLLRIFGSGAPFARCRQFGRRRARGPQHGELPRIRQWGDFFEQRLAIQQAHDVTGFGGSRLALENLATPCSATSHWKVLIRLPTKSMRERADSPKPLLQLTARLSSRVKQTRSEPTARSTCSSRWLT